MDSMLNLRVDYPDPDLHARVHNFLCSRHLPAIRGLEIAVENGTVTLSGIVPTYYEKQVALNSCQHVAGVLALVDEIIVGMEEEANASSEPTKKAPSIK